MKGKGKVGFWVALVGVGLAACRRETVAPPAPAPVVEAPAIGSSPEPAVSPLFTPGAPPPSMTLPSGAPARRYDPSVRLPGAVFTSMKVEAPPPMFKDSTITEEPREKPSYLLPPHKLLPPPQLRSRE
jgi:hypothetical protein